MADTGEGVGAPGWITSMTNCNSPAWSKGADSDDENTRGQFLTRSDPGGRWQVLRPEASRTRCPMPRRKQPKEFKLTLVLLEVGSKPGFIR